MTHFAPPVSRDGFLYQDDFYADMGNLNRHKRASVTDLRAIFHPGCLPSNSDNAASSTAGAEIQDQPGHWWQAQLVHYGLPPSSSKAVAKVRLLESLNDGTLEVPVPVKRLEAKLKNEYEVANRKAKARVKAEQKADFVDVAAERKRQDNHLESQPQEAKVRHPREIATSTPPSRALDMASPGVLENLRLLGLSDDDDEPASDHKRQDEPFPSRATYDPITGVVIKINHSSTPCQGRIGTEVFPFGHSALPVGRDAERNLEVTIESPLRRMPSINEQTVPEEPHFPTEQTPRRWCSPGQDQHMFPASGTSEVKRDRELEREPDGKEEDETSDSDRFDEYDQYNNQQNIQYNDPYNNQYSEQHNHEFNDEFKNEFISDYNENADGPHLYHEEVEDGDSCYFEEATGFW
ncbi:MAG: hypothetical protein M1837_007071 [Sclerophora amabilis]|nr:MAG: hypothetical protein M1837_007071 [Sclerophora amabilis]